MAQFLHSYGDPYHIVGGIRVDSISTSKLFRNVSELIAPNILKAALFAPVCAATAIAVLRTKRPVLVQLDRPEGFQTVCSVVCLLTELRIKRNRKRRMTQKLGCYGRGLKFSIKV